MNTFVEVHVAAFILSELTKMFTSAKFAMVIIIPILY